MTDHASHDRRLLFTLFGLVALTVTSYLLAQVPTGPAGAPIAFGIAAVKACLVAVVFMEVRSAGTAAWGAAVVAILFILLLVGGTVVDVAYR